MSTAPLVTIFVRHSVDCRYKGDEFCKRCSCRKHLRWTLNGKQFRKMAGTRSWQEAEAQKRRLEDQLAGRRPEAAPEQQQTIRTVFESFLTAKKVQNIKVQTQQRYRSELERFVAFCEDRSTFTFAAVTLSLLTEYQATWPGVYESSYTRHYVQKRLRIFLKYAVECGYFTRVPKMAPIRIDEPPTMPLTEREYEKLLAAVPRVFGNGRSDRVRGVIQTMRWSGLAVRDAATLKRVELEYDEQKDIYRITVARQKTGVHVSVPIPKHIAKELLGVNPPESEYLFWAPHAAGVTSEEYTGHNRSQEISRVFTEAGIPSDGHMRGHRLRDTFAADLLEKGVPLEEVSKLLGHESIQTTERHYAKWVRGRQDRLDALVTGTWNRK